MFCWPRLFAAFLIALVLGVSVAAAPAVAAPSSAASRPCHEQMRVEPHTASAPQSVVVTALPDQTPQTPCAAGHRHHECCFVSYLSQTGLVVPVPKGDKVGLPLVTVTVSPAQGGIFKPPRALA